MGRAGEWLTDDFRGPSSETTQGATPGVHVVSRGCGEMLGIYGKRRSAGIVDYQRNRGQRRREHFLTQNCMNVLAENVYGPKRIVDIAGIISVLQQHAFGASSSHGQV